MQQLQFDTRLSSATTTDWSSFCRQVCIDAVTTLPQPIGEPGKVVEIGESLFGKTTAVKGTIQANGCLEEWSGEQEDVFWYLSNEEMQPP